MFNNGLNHLLSLIDTTEYSKINVTKPTVGNLTIFQALISVLMQITKSNSMNDKNQIVFMLAFNFDCFE